MATLDRESAEKLVSSLEYLENKLRSLAEEYDLGIRVEVIRDYGRPFSIEVFARDAEHIESFSRDAYENGYVYKHFHTTVFDEVK